MLNEYERKDNSILLWKRESANPSDVTTKAIHHSCWITCLLGLRDGTLLIVFVM